MWYARYRSLLTTLVVVAFTFVSAGCAVTDKQVISQATSAHGQLQPAVVNDPELSGYLQKVGQRIVDTARKTVSENPEFAPKANRSGDTKWMYEGIQFHLVNSKTLNAFTTGGNHVYIYTALFEQCKTEDELAAVVAHEYAHIFCRHVQAGMTRQYQTLAGAAVVGVAGAAVGYSQDKTEGAVQYGTLGATTGMLVGQYLGMGFTRGDEAEADKYGFWLYTRAGWDPNKFGDFFQHMIDAGYDTADASASDHPTLKSRVEWARKQAANQSPNAKQYRRPPIVDDATFARRKQQLAAAVKNTPSDESLAQAQTLLAAFSSCVAPIDQPEQRAIKEEAARQQAKQQQSSK